MSHDEALRILLIEDTPADARFIRETLRDATDQSLDRGRELSGGRIIGGGVPELIHETELESGLKRLDEENPDLALLDLGLPDSQGLDTLSTFLDHTETVPVVVLTGLLDREVGMEALRMGAEEYLVKDEITPDLLIRSVYHAIERRAREREQKRYETLIEESTDVNVIVDPDGTLRYFTPSVEHVLGYDPDTMAGENVFELIHPDDRAAVEAEFAELVENSDYRPTIECRFEHADGSWVTLHVRGRNLLDDPAIEGIVVYTRDITERREYEERLETLNEVGQELAQVETTEEVARIGLQAVDRIFGVDVGCVRLFDAEANAFDLVAMTEAAEDLVASRPAFELEKTLAGRAYRGEEVVHDREDGEDPPAGAPIGASLHLPLGGHGVVSIFSPDAEEFEDLEIALAEALAARVRGALDRAVREETLRANERELRQQHEQLDTLHRITTLVQEIGDHLIEATTREELERTICERVAASELYRSAWIGEVGVTGDRVDVTAGAGVGDDYLDALDRMSLELLGDGTVEEAIETGEIEVIRQYQTGVSGLEPDADEEAQRVEATAAIPLAYGERIHGVLVVNGVREDVFSENAIAGFESLGRLAGFALTALRNRELLRSDAIVELELTVTDPTDFYTSVTADLGCRCRFDRSVPTGDGEDLNYHLIEGAEPERVLESARESEEIEAAEIVAERDEGFVLQTVADSSMSQLALRVGASLQSAVIEDGEARLTLEVPQSADIREIVNAFDTAFANVDVSAKRERERAVRTATEYRESVAEQLTEKQRATLEAAYAAGYYDWPREISAENLADSMDISSATLHQHLRIGERKLLSAFLEEECSTDR